LPGPHLPSAELLSLFDARAPLHPR
jgi:hypothetical protein